MPHRQKRKPRRVCVQFNCGNALLRFTRNGESFQSGIGFVINRTGRNKWICPRCAGYY